MAQPLPPLTIRRLCTAYTPFEVSETFGGHAYVAKVGVEEAFAAMIVAAACGDEAIAAGQAFEPGNDVGGVEAIIGLYAIQASFDKAGDQALYACYPCWVGEGDYAACAVDQGYALFGAYLGAVNVGGPAPAQVFVEGVVYGGGVAALDECLGDVGTAHRAARRELGDALPGYVFDSEGVELFDHALAPEESAFT